MSAHDTENIKIALATIHDVVVINQIDSYKRDNKINKAIKAKECYLIYCNSNMAGYAIFNHQFFNRAWLELIEIKEELQKQGIGTNAIRLLFAKAQSDKFFTSTNESNIPMQKTLLGLGFVYAGKVDGLDDGDPELFYFKELG